MKLCQVKIKNFRGYGLAASDDGFYTFDHLDQSLVVFNGFNGFGKTSFFEAIEWCLTDNISRLNALKKDVYDIPTLKTSHYLKFFPLQAKKKERYERLIEVELTFDNGLVVKRTSSNNCLSVSDKDKYESSLSIQFGDEQTQYLCNSVENRALAALALSQYFVFTHDPAWDQQVMNAHFLGQESMNEFLRARTPSERRSTLLRLLNVNDLETIFEKSYRIKQSTKLDNKIAELDSDITEFETRKKELEELFSTLNLGSFDQYFVVLNEKVTQLHQLAEHHPVFQDLHLQDLFGQEGIKQSNCLLQMEKISMKKVQIQAKLTQSISKRQELSRLQGDLQKLLFFERRLLIENDKRQLQFLQNTDYFAIHEQRNSLEQDILRYEMNRGAITEKLQQLSEFVIPYEHLTAFITEKPPWIASDFWKMFDDEASRLKSFSEMVLTGMGDQKIPSMTLDVDQLKITYELLEQRWGSIQREILEKTGTYERLSEMNQEYRQVLEQVKQHIIDRSEKVGNCPVCLNDDFSSLKYEDIFQENKPSFVSDQILQIINYSLSNGDQKVNDLLTELTALKKTASELEETIRTNVIHVISKQIQDFSEQFHALYNQTRNQFNIQLLEIDANRVKLHEQAEQFDVLLQNYRDVYQLLFEESEFFLDEQHRQLLESRLRETNESIEEWNKQMIEKGYVTLIPTLDEMKENVSILKTKEKVGDYYPDRMLELERHVNDESENIRNLEMIMQHIDMILKYKIPEEKKDIFGKYAKNLEEIQTKREELHEFRRYKRKGAQIYDNTYKIQQQIIADRLYDNKLINWIYRLINPHPFYKEIRLEEKNKGINVKDVEGEVYLDQIFSAAQLNVLALSIFFGIGLSQHFSKWDQLFLDDPIQSMDDVKILAFIDMLRAMMDSRVKSKHLMLSTHDDNFAKLLAIKFRNKSYTQYNFTGYSKEGPLYQKIIQ
ncbi:AAA family ATPase [Paenibacillus ehimensis]|uniref:Nuclease SbcCD subunit C n=1 Tax=Paenibacillus ehimensis TaxID=79264 RepID=A0ABT8VFH7_9BACL|nr:AAA family ATPase [Paenibacillus ehimensis]MDO3679730.1 AAA family ATPase [Paenibacillus ehimensis]